MIVNICNIANLCRPVSSLKAVDSVQVKHVCGELYKLDERSTNVESLLFKCADCLLLSGEDMRRRLLLQYLNLWMLILLIR